MGSEQDQSQELSVARSPEEIQKRIKKLEDLMDLNQVQINVGSYVNPVMRYPESYEIFQAKLLELKWILGQDVPDLHSYR